MKWAWRLAVLAALLLFIEIAAGLSRSTDFIWNEVRIARSAAIAHGVPIYLGKDDAGAVIGTLHTPVSHCLYLAAALLPGVTAPLMAGSLLSLLFVLGPLGWMLVRAKPPGKDGGLAAMAAFLFCGFLIVGTQGPYNTAFMIHTDAAALGFATLACGILADSRRPLTMRQVWFAGISCALVIGCKQTLAPLAVALLLFIAVMGGWKAALHFAMALVAGGAVLLAAIFAVVPASAFLFNTVTLAAHRPAKPETMKLLVRAFREGKNDSVPALFPLVFFGVFGWMSYRRGISVREFVRANRWLLFPLTAAVLIPTSAKAMITAGGDVNHLGLVIYFLFAGAALEIEQYLMDAEHAMLRRAAWLFAGLGILLTLAPGTMVSLASGLRSIRTNATETAYRYEMRHPGRAYFPCNPLASLRASGHVYHVEYALYDREIAGYPLSSRQIASGLPPQFESVAVPPGEFLVSKALRDLIAGYSSGSDPELPGWTLYRHGP